jgi:VanZ family protein
MFAGIVLSADRGGKHFWDFLNTFPLGDKFGHLALVGTFSLLANLALRGRRAPGRLSWMMLGTLGIATIMTLEECSQAFFPARTLDGLDELANLTGAGLGELAARFLLRRKAAAVVVA